LSPRLAASDRATYNVALRSALFEHAIRRQLYLFSDEFQLTMLIAGDVDGSRM
jgi:hypothetical protein